MRIVVIADGITQKEFQDKEIPAGVTIQFVTTIANLNAADAFFYLLEEDDLQKDIEKIAAAGALVFVNALARKLPDLPPNCVRICGWRGFLLQDTIEICTTPANIEAATKILNGLKWQARQVPDLVGLVAPRITAVLINEAYTIINHDPGQKASIDSAIKHAANFSGGPFELAEKVGLKKIFNLLVHLTASDSRYSPAPLLKKETADLGAAS